MIKRFLVEKMNLVFSIVLEATFEVYKGLFRNGFQEKKKRKKEKENKLNNKNYFLFFALKYSKCSIL